MDQDAGLSVKTPEEIGEILSELRRRLGAIYGQRLRGLYLYGSYARGEARPGSDLDVLVVLDHVGSYGEEIKRTSVARGSLAFEHDVSISLAYVSEDDWERGDAPLLSSIRREGRAA